MRSDVPRTSASDLARDVVYRDKSTASVRVARTAGLIALVYLAVVPLVMGRGVFWAPAWTFLAVAVVSVTWYLLHKRR